MAGEVDYHGAIVVVEASPDAIVLVHPRDDAYASLPGDPCRPDEAPAAGAMLDRGSGGAVAAYQIDALPEIVPVRVAVQRVLATYLAERD